MIKAPGLYDDIPERDYHADPCPLPSLSNSLSKLLVNQTPMHAYYEHPRLNKARMFEEKEPTRAMEIGTAFHKIFLGKGRDVIQVPFENYRKDAARIMRDEARAAGQVPILQDDMQRVDRMVEAARDQLAGTRFEKMFTGGKAEVTMAWQEQNGVWCRGRLDYLPDYVREGGHVEIADMKTTSGSSHADDWQSIAFDKSYDYQSVLYPRGLQKLIPGLGEVEFWFAVIEQDEPHALNMVRMGRQAIAEAEEMVELAIKMWGVCMKRGEWPGFDLDEGSIIDPAFWRSSQKELRRLAGLHRVDRWQRPLETKAA